MLYSLAEQVADFGIGVDHGSFAGESHGIVVPAQAGIQVAKLAQGGRLAPPVSQFDPDSPGLHVGHLSRLKLSCFPKDDADTVPGQGDLRWLAETLEGLAGIVVRRQSLCMATLPQPHGAEFAAGRATAR